MATGLTVCQDIRSRLLCTSVRRPCLRLRLSSGKQEGAKESRQCGRVCDRTFIGRLGCERGLRVAAGNRGRSAAPACAAGQRNGRQTSGNAGCCRRDARRERESASRSFARSFTGRILYNLFGMDLSECNAHAFSAASQTRFCERRTVRSQLRVARAEERGGRSRWQDRHGLYVETAVCFERLRRKRRRGDVLRGVTHVGLRSCRCP